jgi:hypothetical protein
MRTRKLIVVCAIAAIGMAACSSSSKSASTATNPSGASTTIGSSGNGSGSNSGGGSGGGDFCNKVKSDAQAFSNSGFTGKTAQDLKSEYDGLDAKLEQMKSDVPDAIKSDFDTYITFIKKIQTALAKANYDYTKLAVSDLTGLADPKLASAGEHIGLYLSQHCGIAPPTT